MSKPLEFVFGDLKLQVATNGSRAPLVTLWENDCLLASDTFRPASARSRTAFMNALPAELAEDARQWLAETLPEAGVTITQEQEIEGRSTPVADLAALFATPDPWPEEVNGADLLDELEMTLRRFVALGTSQAAAVVLWAVATHLVEFLDIAPRLAFQSATKGCGKTRALEILQLLVRKGLPTSNISVAALFRIVEAHRPTILVDEVDGLDLSSRDELRSLLNAGHNRSTAYVIRCDADTLEPRIFDVFGFVALAGIGNLPDTLSSRSVRVQLRRKRPDERVERFRAKRTPPELLPLRRRIERWAADHAERLADADPETPGLIDRDSDNWATMIAIADLAGRHWPQRGREAALELCGLETDDVDDAATLILGDLATLFSRRGVERLATTEILADLTLRDDRPWCEWRHGKPLSARGLARLLRRFGIVGSKWREGATTCRGYSKTAFADGWGRYGMLPGATLSATSATSLPDNNLTRHTNRHSVADGDAPKSLQDNDVADVADKQAGVEGITTKSVPLEYEIEERRCIQLEAEE